MINAGALFEQRLSGFLWRLPPLIANLTGSGA